MQEFQVWDWKRGDITLDNLPKDLADGMNEDVNSIFKMYKQIIAQIDECKIVYVQVSNYFCNIIHIGANYMWKI